MLRSKNSISSFIVAWAYAWTCAWMLLSCDSNLNIKTVPITGVNLLTLKNAVNVQASTSKGFIEAPIALSVQQGAFDASIEIAIHPRIPENQRTLECEGLPDFVTLDAPLLQLYFKPNRSEARKDLTFSCTLPQSLAEPHVRTMHFLLNVLDEDFAPTLALNRHENLTSLSGSGTESAPYQVTLAADAAAGQIRFDVVDEDGEVGSLGCDDLPSFVVVDATSKVLKLTPTSADVKSGHTFVCKALSGTKTSAEPLRFVVDVTASAVTNSSTATGSEPGTSVAASTATSTTTEAATANTTTTNATVTASQAPPDPTNLNAVSSSTTQINLSWTSGGGSTAGYQISYQSGASAPSSCAAGTVISNSAISGTTYTITSLGAGAQVSVRVCAINSGSPALTSTGITASATTTSEAVPVNPQSPAATANSASEIALVWTSGGGTTVDYRIAYTTGATAPTECASGTQIGESLVTGETHNVSGLTHQTQYSFRICAVNANATPDASSGVTITATTQGQAAPANPTSPSATVNSASQITLDWTSGGGTTADYRIAYTTGATAPANCAAGTQINESSVADVSHAITNLTHETQYSFRICAINANANPDASSGVTVTATTASQASPPNPMSPAATTVGTSQVDLAWTSGGGTTADYRIAYATGATAPATCASVTQISEAAITGTAHAVTGLTFNTQYSFRICAINANATPDASTGVTVTATTQNQAAPPDPTSPNATVNSASQITLDWTSGGGTTADYRISYQTGATAPATCSSGTQIGEGAISGVSHAVTGLTHETQYSFRICAINSSGTPDASGGVSVTATTQGQAAPAGPTSPSATVNSASQISLDWTSGGGTTADYRISYASGVTAPSDCATGTLIYEGSITGVSHAITGLTHETQYSFRICAINANAAPNVSAGVTVTATTQAQAAPANPTSPSATVNSASQITLDWTSGGGTTADYRIAYTTGASAPADCASGTQINDGSVSGVSHAVTGLTHETQYSFRICAINANGTPDVSPGVSVTASTQSQAAPANPTSPSATANSASQITLDWTSGGGTTADYRISYATGATAPADCTSGTQIGEGSVSGVSHAVTGLTANTQYSFRICAINANALPNQSTGVTTSATTDADGLLVEPVYSNATLWNSFVTNNGANVYSANNTVCPNTGNYYTSCINGGLIKKVVITNAAVTTCTNATYGDNLGVFDWTCVDSGSNVILYSTGFKSGKGLADLLTGAGWKTNFISFSGQGESLSSNAAVWWTNTVSALPDSSSAPIALTTPNMVYVIAANEYTRGIDITTDHISIVTLGSNKLIYNGTGEVDYMLNIGAYKRIYLEGTYDADGSTNDATYVFKCFGCKYIRIHRFTAYKGRIFTFPNYHCYMTNVSSYYAVGNGMSFGANQTGYNVYEDLYVESPTAMGLIIEKLKHQTFRRVKIRNAGTLGILVYHAFSTNIFFYDFEVTNSGSVGFQSEGNDIYVERGIVSGSGQQGFRLVGLRNYISQVVSANNAGSNFYMAGGVDSNFAITASTSLNSGASDLEIANTDNITIQQFLGINAASDSIKITGSSGDPSNDITMSQLAVAHGSATAISLGTDVGVVKLYGNILYNTGGCLETNDGTQGISDSCVPNSGNTATMHPNTILAASLNGKVTFNEPSNSSDNTNADGTADYPADKSAFDWLGFEDPFFRSWGKDGGAFADSTNRGRWTSGVGRIWDYTLEANDTVLLNTSGDGNSANDAFPNNGGACPSEVDGTNAANFVTDSATSPNTYLLNAVEILDPTREVSGFVGDNNGLCESNETCIFTPNFGAYQGHGNYLSQAYCTFSNGTVTNVKLYGYPSNGRNIGN